MGASSASLAAVAGWTVATVLLQVAGLSLFLYGFFPVKPTLRDFNGAESFRMPSCGPVSGEEEELALPPDQLRSLYMAIGGLPAELGGKPPTREMESAIHRVIASWLQSSRLSCEACTSNSHLYTIVLLVMRNHLFVWSVFSPKYLYVCEVTVCTYVGVLIIAMTAIYTTTAFSLRARSCIDKSI